MPATIHLELKIDGSDKAIDGGRLKRFMYHQSTVGSGWFMLDVEDVDWTYWDEVYDPETELQMRWGSKVAGEEKWSEWHTMLVHDVSSKFLKGNVSAQIMGMDKCYFLNTTCSKKVFKEKLVSEMVEELVNEAGLESDVESTKDKFSLAQGTLTDGQFMRHICVPYAYSASRFDFLLYTEQGKKVIFRPPDLSDLQGEYTFGGMVDGVGAQGPMDLHYRPLMLTSNLAYSTEFRGFDPLKKKAEFFEANEGSVSYPKLDSEGPPVPDDPAHILPASWTREFKTRVKAIYSQTLRELWVLEFVSTFAPDLVVGKIVKINVTSPGPGDKNHGMAGKYILGGVVHYIDFDNIKAYTRLFLQRRTARIG
jgi:hypothetical protein